MSYDVVIHSGTYFDGTGAEPRQADVGIVDGHVVEVAPQLDRSSAGTVIDASERWVMPGFIDNHTHYDAELLLAPGLGESVRHGVTTVCVGSCSLSTIYSSTEDCADLFSRVEAVPREHVLEALADKAWNTAADYAQRLDALALGPNVMAFIGHSDLRTAVMGLEAATEKSVRPTREQLAAMESALEQALDAGFLGLSCMTNPWDKIGGDRVRSRPLPSTFATWGEYRRLHRILRRREAILQSAPNITTKVNAILYLIESAGFGFRKPLKSTLITVADTKANPMLSATVLGGTGVFNRLFGGDLRWQSVPMPFEVYADGIDLVIFEEFGAGEEALHLVDQVERNTLFRDPAYRRRFRKDYDKRFGPRVWQRDFHDAEIVSAPDPALAGKSFGELADARGEHPVDTFLDLVMEHGRALRWKTTIANHRPDTLNDIITHPAVQVGFADSGAHLRNMAFYNFPLYFLRTMLRAEQAGKPLLPMGQAVHRVTGEIGDWLGIDAGHIRVGDRADLAIINPAGLDDSLDDYHEAPVDVYGGLRRMVRRNDAAVTATLVGGELIYTEGHHVPGLGRERAYGQFLRRGEKIPARATRSRVGSSLRQAV
ncbi:MAG: amidohydrolase family protein [Myxococcota bacterium]